jgi:hypothetical protein
MSKAQDLVVMLAAVQALKSAIQIDTQDDGLAI